MTNYETVRSNEDIYKAKVETRRKRAEEPFERKLLALVRMQMIDYSLARSSGRTARKPLGGVYPGERVTHGLMAILYGAMPANFVPTILEWNRNATAFSAVQHDVPSALSWTMTATALGVLLSGVRDLCEHPRYGIGAPKVSR